MLTAIRELAEEAEAGGDLAAVIARGDDCVARTRELLPVLAEAGRRRRGRGRARRDRPRHRGGARRASRCRSPPALPQPRRRRVDPPAALRVQVLHGVRRRGRAPRRRRRSSGSSSRSATRCSSSATRTALKVHVHTDDPGRALSLGGRARHDRGRRDREHARADTRARAASAPRRPGCAGSCRAPSSPSPRVRATGGCSRASARTSSTAGAR